MLLKKKKGIQDVPSYEHPEVSEIKGGIKPVDPYFDVEDKKGKKIMSRMSSTDLPKLKGMQGYEEESNAEPGVIPSLDEGRELSMEDIEKKFSNKMETNVFKDRSAKEKQIFIKIDNFKQIVESIENIQKKLEELEGIVSKLEQIKERENEELTESKNDLSDLKDRLNDISKNLSEVEG